MLYEIIVLIMACLNALQRPRDIRTPLTKVFHSDGILFFLVSIGSLVMLLSD